MFWNIKKITKTIILIATTILILNEASDIVYTLISTGKTLRDVTPYQTEPAPNYHRCVSLCQYDVECLSFDFTPDSPVGKCNFYDVRFVMGNQTHQLIEKPGTSFYSSVPGKKDCADWYKQGYTTNGVYEIMVLGQPRIRVYCNMEEDGGGWIVFQRRFDGTVDFARTWNEYREGFGDVSGEYWLGNKWLNLLTKSELYDYYVIAYDSQGIKQTKKMLGVTVEDENLKYQLAFQQEGTGDSSYGMNQMNGVKFSTFDQDNDQCNDHCSVSHGGNGGWWFKNCHGELMNGKYIGTSVIDYHGLVWYGWKNSHENLKETWLMIRSRSFN